MTEQVQINVDDEKITLELTVNEVNAILRSLGKHPFDEIAALIGKIRQQGESQLQEIVQAAQAAPAEEAK